MTQKILINEPHLVFSPTLAVIIGINEAIILDKMNKFINGPKNKNFHNNMNWVYNSYEDWKSNYFPCMSVSTIKRSIKKLEALEILIAGNFNKKKYDRTKHYTIDYDRLYEIVENFKTDSLRNVSTKSKNEHIMKNSIVDSNLSDYEEKIDESLLELNEILNKRKINSELTDDKFNLNCSDAQNGQMENSELTNEPVILNLHSNQNEQTYTNIQYNKQNIKNIIKHFLSNFSGEKLPEDKSSGAIISV